ncbi:hypothetical protein MAR_023307 [Mya arenaria]|uniref:Uncharacterized protein n=1 Tax=Mya arenaria TaxID=6604 RepID=A0ABY7DNJ2_MYAAR|nr:uncharacterized protein LOC128228500 [Mya arenaria]WAQ98934.1 hypothetical protein MAR_023307 [Mya arenaria]
MMIFVNAVRFPAVLLVILTLTLTSMEATNITRSPGTKLLLTTTPTVYNQITPKDLNDLKATSNDVRGNKTVNKVISESDSCRIKPFDREQVQYLRYSVMYIFEIQIYNESDDPLRTDKSRTYKPWKWYRTTSEHGKTLLTLSFNYDILSMSILTIGVQRVPLKIKDVPEGCFKSLTPEERVAMIRHKVFDNFKKRKSRRNTPADDEEELEYEVTQPEVTYVCNEIVRDVLGKAVFANRCCARDAEGDVTCSEQEDNLWITVLYICIFLVKLMLFMFCPLLVPSNMYTASYVASEYVVKLAKELKFKMFVSESTTTSVRYKHRFTLDDISEWHRLRECVENFPLDEIVDVKMPELRIKVKGKRIIPANEPPTGLMRTIYDNLIRCKIRRLEPFKACCDKSIYASLAPLFKHTCTWENLVLMIIKIICLLLVPAPFYLRTFIYYKFEKEEIDARKELINELGLVRTFNPFRSNIVQYLSPTHSLFISAYSVYIISGMVIGFSADATRDKLKAIVRSAFHDMQNVSRTNVLQEVIGFLLWPFRKMGLFALISCPIISAVTAPLWTILFVLYCVPTVYLGYRLLFHIRKRLGSDNDFFDSGKPLGKAKRTAYKFHKHLAKIDKNVHITRTTFSEEEGQSPCITGFGRLAALRRLLVQMLVSLFFLVVLLASVLLFVEAAGVIVEVLVFTMMGIIVNAGSTLRYVSMALLVIVYMHSCYDNVYENYLMFNNTIIDAVMDKVEDLKKVASLPSSMQENMAFPVKPVEAVDEIPTTLNLEKKDAQWRIGHLVLFLDSNDTPRIPLNLFKLLCEVRVHGAPGPIYINLLKATGKFSIIVVFLFFVMIVVMAFGSANQMSSTNQTLATLAGGFVPMLLKNVLSSKGTKLNLKTLSFKGQIDEIVSEYKQGWPIYDMIIERYDPNAVDEPVEGEDKDKDKPGGDDKDNAKKPDAEKDSKENNETENKEERNGKETLGKVPSFPTLGNTLLPAGAFSESLEHLRPVGIEKEGPAWFRRMSINPIEDNQVDIFVDLSVSQESSPWNWIFGSSESLDQSLSILNEVEKTPSPGYDPRMPYDPNMNTDTLERKHPPNLNQDIHT